MKPISVRVEYPDSRPFVAVNNDLPTHSTRVQYEAYVFDGEVYRIATLFDADSNNVQIEWDSAPDWLKEMYG